MRTCSLIGWMTALAVAGGGRLCAQPAGRGSQVPSASKRTAAPATRPAQKKTSNTMITMEILTASDGVGLKARQWNEVLSKLDVTFSIRRGAPDEKIEVTERKAGGSVRAVRVVGMLDSRGRLIFPDQIFTENDSAKLATWLNELRTYGAQGDPQGRPVWGLTREQFGVVHAAMKKLLASEPKDLELSKALALFELPKDHPLRFSAAAKRLLDERKSPAEAGQALKGISQGTALAILFSEQGLGFRPRRLPDGTIELTVYTLAEQNDVWPIGWPREKPPAETTPTLFEFKTIDLEDQELDEILEAVSGKQGIGLPILIDRAGLAAADIDLSQAKVSFPRKRTTWKDALTTMTFKARTRFDVLIDEAGKPFLWVTPLNAPARPQKD